MISENHTRIIAEQHKLYEEQLQKSLWQHRGRMILPILLSFLAAYSATQKLSFKTGFFTGAAVTSYRQARKSHRARIDGVVRNYSDEVKRLTNKLHMKGGEN